MLHSMLCSLESHFVSTSTSCEELPSLMETCCCCWCQLLVPDSFRWLLVSVTVLCMDCCQRPSVSLKKTPWATYRYVSGYPAAWPNSSQSCIVHCAHTIHNVSLGSEWLKWHISVSLGSEWLKWHECVIGQWLVKMKDVIKAWLSYISRHQLRFQRLVLIFAVACRLRMTWWLCCSGSHSWLRISWTRYACMAVYESVLLFVEPLPLLTSCCVVGYGRRPGVLTAVGFFPFPFGVQAFDVTLYSTGRCRAF